jgi:DHA1 family tetracycline resistance protein-like MFS transporter
MKIKQIDKRLLTVLLIVFVQMLGASMVLPILPLFALRQFEMDPLYIPLLATAFFLAQAIAGPYLGRLSDKYGRVPVLIISQIGTAISFVMIGFAQSVAILFFARILDGITGGNIIVAQAYVTDITPKEKRTQSLGLIFAAFGLGFVFGPAIGGVLSASFGSTVPFLIAAAAATLVVLLTYFTLDESLTPEQRAKNRQKSSAGLRPTHIITNTPLLFILVVVFVGQFVHGLLISTFALYGEAVLFAGYSERLTDLGIGLLLTIVGISQFITQVAILPRMVQRFNDPIIVVAGLLIRGFGTFLYAVITTPWLGAVGSVAFAMGMGLLMPPLQSMSTRTVDDELRGGVLGVSQSTVSISTIISTAVAGLLFDWNPTMPYQLGVLLTMIALIPALALIKIMPDKEVSSPATAVTD